MESIDKYINDNDRFTNHRRVNEPVRQDITAAQAEALAEYIQAELGADGGSKAFYCKVAYYLPVATIESLLLTAKKLGSNKPAYFGALASKELGIRK